MRFLTRLLCGGILFGLASSTPETETETEVWLEITPYKSVYFEESLSKKSFWADETGIRHPHILHKAYAALMFSRDDEVHRYDFVLDKTVKHIFTAPSALQDMFSSTARLLRFQDITNAAVPLSEHAEPPIGRDGVRPRDKAWVNLYGTCSFDLVKIKETVCKFIAMNHFYVLGTDTKLPGFTGTSGFALALMKALKVRESPDAASIDLRLAMEYDSTRLQTDYHLVRAFVQQDEDYEITLLWSDEYKCITPKVVDTFNVAPRATDLQASPDAMAHCAGRCRPSYQVRQSGAIRVTYPGDPRHRPVSDPIHIPGLPPSP
ncbi:MAG: hypothetical protein M1825_005446 [Sarcosagium campestre]|nr:MAG: hypothetical protein M1825_005446 [Sarcosagium campestre]